MQLKAQTLFPGEICHALPEPVVAGVLGVNAGVHADAALVVTMPLFHEPLQFLALGVGFKVKILVLVLKAIGGQSQIAFHACFVQNIRRGLRIII